MPSAKSLTGTLWPPSASERPISTKAESASQRARLMTMLKSAIAPASTSDQNSSSRMTSTLYDLRSSGVVRYSGKWNASTPRKQSAASIRAITPETMPLPGCSAPCDSLRRFSLSICCFMVGQPPDGDGRPVDRRELLRRDVLRRCLVRVWSSSSARNRHATWVAIGAGAGIAPLTMAWMAQAVVGGVAARRQRRRLREDAFLRGGRELGPQGGRRDRRRGAAAGARRRPARLRCRA